MIADVTSYVYDERTACADRDDARDSTRAAHEDHDRTARGDTTGLENKGKGRGKKPVKP